jgi:tetratricopeptide (TPR) repeat protein
LKQSAQDATAHRVLASVHLHFDWDLGRAEREARAAVRLAPEAAEGHLLLAAVLAAARRHPEAIDAARRAIELDPASLLVRSDLSFFYLAAGRPEEAAREARAALSLEPGFAPALDFLIGAYQELGAADKAREAAREFLLERKRPPGEVALLEVSDPRDALRNYWKLRLEALENLARKGKPYPLPLALHHARLGNGEAALNWLETAYEGRDPNLIFLDCFRDFRALRLDPRFNALAARVDPGRRGTAGARRAPPPARSEAQSWLVLAAGFLGIQKSGS